MRQYVVKVFGYGLSVASFVFAAVPEDFFEYLPSCFGPYWVRVFAGRMLALLAILAGVAILYAMCLKIRRSVTLKQDNCKVVVKYGDLFKEKDCRRVISFDAYYTTSVGTAPQDIRAESVCGQYLDRNPDLDIDRLIEAAGLEPILDQTVDQAKGDGRSRFHLGSVVENGDDLLLAFAGTSEKGRAEFSSRDEYLACLSRLWEELYLRHGGKDVCIPILGSGATEFIGGFGQAPTQQDLLDTILRSYFLSARKIKEPNKLRIICTRQEGFSINRIGLA